MPEVTLWKSLTWSGFPLQGRMKVHGMDISIENRKGSVRRGVDKDGHAWKTKMHYAYGYIRGTVGRDKDHLDCYVGPDKESLKVFIVHQNDPATGAYDEDKVMLGWNSAEEAKAAYLKQYDRPGFFGSMDETDIDTFRAKALAKKNHGKKLVLKAMKTMGNRFFTENELRGAGRMEKLIDRKYPEELAVGIKVEMEHTSDLEEARRIALDHLSETLDYYSRLIAAGLVDEPKALALARRLGLKKSMGKKTVAIDFDGVINSYKSGWKGPAETDEPVPGAALAINTLVDRGYKVVIYSTRAGSPEGKKAIARYLSDMDVEPRVIEITDKKPIADVYIDDRAVTFDGNWPAMLERVESFKPWIEKSMRLVIPAMEKARKSPRLVPQHRSVTRDGTTFQTTVWVLPGDDASPAQGGFDFDAPAPKAAVKPEPVEKPRQSEAYDRERSRISEARAERQTDASLKRGRNDIMFEKPYVGKTGAKLLGYEWPHIKVEEVDKRGEEVVRRYSDWTMADISDMTGRKFVHKFIIERTDGTETTLSAESAAVALGLSEAATRSKARKMLEDEIKHQKYMERVLAEADAIEAGPWHETPAEAMEKSDAPFIRSWIKHKNWGERKRESIKQYGSDSGYYGREILPFLKDANGRYQFAFAHDSREELARRGITERSLEARQVWDENGNPRMWPNRKN